MTDRSDARLVFVVEQALRLFRQGVEDGVSGLPDFLPDTPYAEGYALGKTLRGHSYEPDVDADDSE